MTVVTIAALILVAPPCGQQHVCAYQKSLCISATYYRLDQKAQAARARELADCRADLDGARAEGHSTETLLTRRIQACKTSLQHVQDSALTGEAELSARVAEAEAERDSRWSAGKVMWLTVGVAASAGLVGGLVGWLAR